MDTKLPGNIRRFAPLYDSPCVTMFRVAVMSVIAGAVLVMAGYILHVDAFIWLKPGLTGMSLLTAMALLALGLGTIASSTGSVKLSRVLSAAVTAFGAAILTLQARYGVDSLSLKIDSLMGYAVDSAPQVSLATAFCLSALGLALVFSAYRVVSEILALTVIVLSGFGLLGYAYNVHELYALPIFKSMALHTAASLQVLAVASVLLRPEGDWCSVIGAKTEAGAATRRQLSFMFLPIIAGAILVRVIAYGVMGPAAALALLVAITVTSLGLLILRDGRRLVDLDEVRHAKDSLTETLHARMEARLAEQEADIQQQHAEQAQAQSAMFRSQRLEALSRLTGSIAHDFNNLLQAIGGSLELLPRRIGAGMPVEPLLDRVKVAVRRGAQLGGQLLAFSKTQKLDVRLLSLDDLMMQSRPLIASALGPTIEVVYDTCAEGAWVWTDKNQFSLALLNIALNARDALPNGGQVTVETRLDGAAFPERREAAGVAIQIHDSGVGMSADTLARASEPFFSTKPEGTASGLGLAQVASLLRQSEGELEIRSRPGQGTTVALVFPTRKAPGTVPTLPSGAHATVAESSPLVLVIEDDEAVREGLVGGLNSLGYRVLEAADGLSGIALLQKAHPAVAVIDFLMPDMNGALVAQRARADRPDLPILFVSGHFDTAALEEFSNSRILRKPFELKELQANLVAVMQ